MLKKVCYAIYAHRLNLDEFMDAIPDTDRELARVALSNLSEQYPWDICKYDRNRHSISIIRAPTWFDRWEPIVGDSWCMSLVDSSVKYRKGGKQIYHCRYQFMPDDYDPEWLKTDRERVELWNSIPNIKAHKCRIGNLNYWEQLLKENDIEL